MESIPDAAQTDDSDAPPRSRRFLVNAAALLILAVASGVLAPVVIETGGFNAINWFFGRTAPRSNAELPTAATPAAEQREAGGLDSQSIDALARELTSAREEIALLRARLAAEVAERSKVNAARQAAEAAAEERKQALEREWEHTATLEQALSAAHQELQGLRASALVVGTPIPVKTVPVSAGAPGYRTSPGDRAEAAR